MEDRSREMAASRTRAALDILYLGSLSEAWWRGARGPGRSSFLPKKPHTLRGDEGGVEDLQIIIREQVPVKE
jgi:hypothetical protein